MKIIVMSIRDLDKLFEKLREHGYVVEESTNTVMTDNSELGEWDIKKNNTPVGKIIAHYIRHYYAALQELPSNASDKQILETLLQAKYSRNKWASPVEPVLLIVEDEISEILRNYRDEYPSKEAEALVTEYMSRGVEVMTKVARRIIARLEEEGRDDEGSISGGVKKDQPSDT